MLTSPEAAVHIGNIYASFNTGYLSHILFDYDIYSSVVKVRDNMCIGGEATWEKFVSKITL